MTAENPEEMPQGDDLQHVLNAAAGLTRYEAEGAFALSLTRHDALRPESIWDLKAQALKKNNLLTLHRSSERFDDLGGLANLKQFCARALRPGRAVKPRGVLLLGVAGSGKSAFAKAFGNETGRPTLLLDVGALLGSLLGQSEANLRQALKVADAMAPCVLFVDELEKALAGVGSAGDSGVATRLFGNVLTWLSDHTSDVFFVGTSNDISKLPPEFARAERFDGLFFLDLPTALEKNAIWSLYRRQYAIPESQTRPDDTSWTGAEIKSCCRLATLLDVTLTQAAHHVVPVAVTAAEQVERLRCWSRAATLLGNCRTRAAEFVPASRELRAVIVGRARRGLTALARQGVAGVLHHRGDGPAFPQAVAGGVGHGYGVGRRLLLRGADGVLPGQRPGRLPRRAGGRDAGPTATGAPPGGGAGMGHRQLLVGFTPRPGGTLARTILIEEFHIVVRAPDNLSDAEYQAIRRTLKDTRFRAELRRAVREVARRQPTLGKVWVVMSR